jgi:hypothetical protein
VGNVDLDEGRVLVSDNAVIVRDGSGDQPKTRINQTSPKSKKSRQVSIDPGTVATLRSWRKTQTEELLALGIRLGDTTPVATRVPLPKELALKPGGCVRCGGGWRRALVDLLVDSVFRANPESEGLRQLCL